MQEAPLSYISSPDKNTKSKLVPITKIGASEGFRMANRPIIGTDEHGNLLPNRNEYGVQTHNTDHDQYADPAHHTAVAGAASETASGHGAGTGTEHTGVSGTGYDGIGTGVGTGTDHTGVGSGISIGTGAGIAGGLHPQQHHEGGGVTDKLHRSGSSSSSSSSEDDEAGGRRKKKGLKEKIKEKLPGRHHKDQPVHGTTTASGTTGAGHVTEQPHEKRGVMEKIKEKLPGHHH